MNKDKFEWKDDDVTIQVPQCITQQCIYRQGHLCEIYNNIPPFAYDDKCDKCESAK